MYVCMECMECMYVMHAKKCYFFTSNLFKDGEPFTIDEFQNDVARLHFLGREGHWQDRKKTRKRKCGVNLNTFQR